MENKEIQFDLLAVIREIKESNFDNFSLEYKDLKISVTSSPKEVVEKAIPVQEPEATPENVRMMASLEKANIMDRIREADEEALMELDFVAPELAGELQRANIIEQTPSGEYAYVKTEELDAQADC